MEMLIQFPYKDAKENALEALSYLISVLDHIELNSSVDTHMLSLAQSLTQSAIQALEAQS